MRLKSTRAFRWLIVLVLTFATAGPGVLASTGAEPVPETRGLSEPWTVATAGDHAPAAVASVGATLPPAPAAGTQGLPEGEPGEREDYDPWESFNERMFAFNRQLDRYVVKPAATAWDTVLPDEAQKALKRAFNNVRMPRRFVNNVLQLKGEAAVGEVLRFIVNSTAGIGGLFDVAKMAGVEESDEDTGQTLGVYGVGPGPYLVLPFLPPLTVRDGIGFGIDGLLNPLSLVTPFAAEVGMKGGDTVNSRSLNLEVFEDVEESVLDLYSAVRNGYLQRRQKAIRE